MMVSKTSAKGKGKWKGKKKIGSKTVAPSKPTFKNALKPTRGVVNAKVDKGDCHYCHKLGH